MRTEYLKTFYAIVEFGSFSKASEQTFLTKQALMNQISTLENELGFPLLIHSNNGMRLTEPGRRFYTFSLKWYKELEQIIDSCRESVNVRHQIRIASPPLPFLEHEALINAFREGNPDIDIKIIYYQDDKHKPLEGILCGTYDICTINLDYYHNDVRGVSYT